MYNSIQCIYADRHTISTYNQPTTSTQPGHPSGLGTAKAY